MKELNNECKEKIAGTLGILIIVSSCSLIDSVLGNLPNNDMGTLLSVDSDGHFKEDIEYDFGDWKITYYKDGSFVEYDYVYSETAGECIHSETWEGTYS